MNYRRTIEQSDGINIKRAFPNGSLEDILPKAFYIYDKYNTEEDQYYELDIDDLGPLVHLLYANYANHRFLNTDVKLISEVISVLPFCFNAPLHTTTEHLINLLSRIKMINGDFVFITNLFANRLLLNPKKSHLEILGELL